MDSLHGSLLCPSADNVFDSLNPEYIKRHSKSHKNKWKRVTVASQPTLPALSTATEVTKANVIPASSKGGLFSLIEILIGYLHASEADVLDIMESTMVLLEDSNSIGFCALDDTGVLVHRNIFIRAILATIPSFPEHTAGMIFSELDFNRRGIVYLHQLYAVVAFSSLRVCSTFDEMIRAILEGIAWEISRCSGGISTTPIGPRQNNAGCQPSSPTESVTAPCMSALYAGSRTRSDKGRKLSDLMLTVPLPYGSIVSSVQTLFPPQHRKRVKGTDDPIESFLRDVYNYALDNIKKNKRVKEIARWEGDCESGDSLTAHANETISSLYDDMSTNIESKCLW
eukprot:CAMPEP_0185036858 /NCGR_PEP_ID=MMETSP1103-20130426/30454_1 /TAXON_ID=36769 /ORGANISM="Paraphysomonas bandaiensis, Strain Caron Lab Isolate" /LENGTH=339 /DNA_ID=CAMNT_0027574583 /DNA_START=289 /DNA_END=1305 /DNA_ORIENTATION=-